MIDDIVSLYIDAVKKNLTISDLLHLASTQHVDAVDNIYRDSSTVTLESKLVSYIDGEPLHEGYRILIKDQHDSTQNGIYILLPPQTMALLSKGLTKN